MRSKFMNNLDRVVDASLFVVLGVMVLSMAVNVISRFIFKYSIPWADELTQSLMLWLTFIGAAAALREGTHYAFTFLDTVMKGRVQTVYRVVGKVFVLLSVCLLLFWSVEVTAGITKWIMPALGINRVWVYGACPVGCVLMLIYAVEDLVKEFKR